MSAPSKKKVRTFSGVISWIFFSHGIFTLGSRTNAEKLALVDSRNKKTFHWTRQKGLPIVSWKKIRFSKGILELNFHLLCILRHLILVQHFLQSWRNIYVPATFIHLFFWQQENESDKVQIMGRKGTCCISWLCACQYDIAQLQQLKVNHVTNSITNLDNPSTGVL